MSPRLFRHWIEHVRDLTGSVSVSPHVRGHALLVYEPTPRPPRAPGSPRLDLAIFDRGSDAHDFFAELPWLRANGDIVVALSLATSLAWRFAASASWPGFCS